MTHPTDRRRAAWIGLWLLATSAGCASPGPAPERGALVALGDSVAAGHGLGDARGYPSNPPEAFPGLVAKELGLDLYNMAISGACSVTPLVDAQAARNCTRSIVEDQLPALPATRASIVLVTIGANDIRFSECFRSFIVNDRVRDPCLGAPFMRHLDTLERNLPVLVTDLRARFGADVRIVLTQYYNPLPPPTDVVEHACDLWGPATLVRRPELVAVPKDSAEFRRAVLVVQKEAWDYGKAVVDELNSRIERVAHRHDALTLRFDATGHDPCATLRGGSVSQTWIFGLAWSEGGSTPVAGPRYTSRPMPGPCPDRSLDPADEEVRVGGVAQGAFVGYSVHVRTNCLAHPTTDGHQAFARQLVAALRRTTS